MIPKQLFFVWLGKKDPPNNINYVINSFKDVNPSFKVDFIHVSDIFNTTDKLVIKCRDLILNNCIDDSFHGCRIKSYHLQVRLGNNILQKVCQLHKNELLYTYGGIYLDCDTFPVDPFDDKLLNYTYFCSKTIYSKKPSSNIFPDDFFMGCEKNSTNFPCDELGNMYCENIIDTYHYVKNDDPLFLQMREKFENKQLKIGDRLDKKSIYIDHYDRRPWLNYVNNCDELL